MSRPPPFYPVPPFGAPPLQPPPPHMPPPPGYYGYPPPQLQQRPPMPPFYVMGTGHPNLVPMLPSQQPPPPFQPGPLGARPSFIPAPRPVAMNGAAGPVGPLMGGPRPGVVNANGPAPLWQPPSQPLNIAKPATSSFAVAPPVVRPLPSGALSKPAAATGPATDASAAPSADGKQEYFERQRKKELARQDQKQKAIVERPATLPPQIKDRTNKKAEWFIAKLKYRNNIPELPFDPKFIAYPFDPMRFVRYTQTSLEANFKFSMRTEPSMGINIDLVDKDLYTPSSDRPKIEGVDAMLAEEDTDLTSSGKKQTDGKPSLRAPWLMPTQLVSSGSTDKSQFKIGGSLKAGSTARVLTREEKIELIKSSFDEFDDTRTTLELKHPNNPKLKPAEVLPIFPDYSLWSNDYVLLSFNKMPAHEKGVFVDVNPIAEDSGVLNSMDIDQAEQLKTSRVLCKRKARDDENDEDEDEGVGQAGDFAVASKYKVLRKTNPDNYIFALRAEAALFYIECPTQLGMSEHRIKDIVKDVSIDRHAATAEQKRERRQRTMEALQVEESDLQVDE